MPCARAEPAAGGTTPAMNAKDDAGSIAIEDGDKPVAVYRFDGVPFKPYMKELYTPGGVNVLRDAPPDHLHHHALMFAIGIEKTDFWSETPGCGMQVGGFVSAPSIGKTPEGYTRKDFTQTLAWMPVSYGKPLAEEEGKQLRL